MDLKWKILITKVGGHNWTGSTVELKGAPPVGLFQFFELDRNHKPSWHFLSIMDATVKYSFLQPRGRYLNTYSIDDQKNLFFEITRCESHKMKREGWTWRRIKTSTRVELCTDCPDLRSLWFTQLQYRPLIWFYANSSNSSVEHSRLFKTECIIATKLFH